MGKAYALILGLILGVHGIVGLFIEGEHLLNVFNVDLFVDILYLVCAAALLTVALGRARAGAIRATSGVVGSALLALGILGLINREVWGLLPTGLTVVDLTILLGAGILGVAVALARGGGEPLKTGGKPIL